MTILQEPAASSKSALAETTDVKPSDGEVEVREKLYLLTTSLPPLVHILMQACFTWMTGKPHQGQEPLFQWTPILHLVTALISLFGSAAASLMIFNSSFWLWFLLPVCWLFTVGAARKLHTNVIHQCVHYNFFIEE